jgi:methylglyoxal reductase
MKYQRLLGIDEPVSVLSLGTWGMGGGSSWQTEQADTPAAVIHRALDLGVNFIDTAPVYGTGHSERVVGDAIADRRSRVILSTKCTLNWRGEGGEKAYSRDGKDVYKNFSPASLRADLEDSLRRLKTDYIDVYITHRQPAPDGVGEVAETLNTFLKEGKIRAIGLSNASPEHLARYQKHCKVSLVQEKLSLLSDGALAEYLPLCRDEGVIFQCYSVLERGLLTGKIDMSYKLAEGEARNTIPWFAPDRRRLVLEMLEGWQSLTDRYGCSLSVLAAAAVRGFSPAANILVGVRRTANLLDIVPAADLEIEKADRERMQADARALCAKFEGLK